MTLYCMFILINTKQCVFTLLRCLLKLKMYFTKNGLKWSVLGQYSALQISSAQKLCKLVQLICFRCLCCLFKVS